MNIACGVDIIEIERVKKAIENEKFIEKIFTKKEIEYCESKNKSRYEHYAGRFAAKEAIFKAISSQLENKFDIEWKNIQVLNDSQGRPFIEFLNIELKFIKNIDISISHCKEYAVANAVMMYEN